MKSRIICAVLAAFTVGYGGAALSGEGTEAFKEGMHDRREGVKEVVTSPSHLVEETAEGTQGDQPVLDTAGGVVEGAVETGDQALHGAGNIVEGTGEVLTAPIEAIAD